MLEAESDFWFLGRIEKTAKEIHDDKLAKLVLLMVWGGADHQAIANALNTGGIKSDDGNPWDIGKVRDVLKGYS